MAEQSEIERKLLEAIREAKALQARLDAISKTVEALRWQMEEAIKKSVLKTHQHNR